MNGKSSKFASAALLALLYAQGMLGFAGVTLVALKDRAPDRIATGQAFAASAMPSDTQVR